MFQILGDYAVFSEKCSNFAEIVCILQENNGQMKFSQVIGQSGIKERLLAMAERGEVPHALLFSGPYGVGKLPMAVAFASYLLGGREEMEDSNLEAVLEHFTHPDLHFSYPVIRPKGTPSEKKMSSQDFQKEWLAMLQEGCYISYGKWLEAMGAENQQAQMGVGESVDLLRQLNLKASMGGYKVSVIWLAEKMNLECANKLLKMLEEPPEGTVFILVTEDKEYLLDTIISRTQSIEFKPLDKETIEEALESRRHLSSEDAKRVARISGGSWSKALEELDADSDKDEYFDFFTQLMRSAYMRQVRQMRQWSEAVAAIGRERQKAMLQYFLWLVRENFIYNFQEEDLRFMRQKEEAFAVNFARFINESNVLGFYDLFSLALRDIQQNANAKILFFDVILQTTVLIKQGQQ